MPASVPKTTRSVPQISVADDIIAIENAASLVAAQFHRHALWNAGADHVADGRSPEVVRNAAGAPGRRPRPPPGLVPGRSLSSFTMSRGRSPVMASPGRPHAAL